jgi:hypothetical protein
VQTPEYFLSMTWTQNYIPLFEGPTVSTLIAGALVFLP